MADESSFENLHDLRIPVELTTQYLEKVEELRSKEPIKEDDHHLATDEKTAISNNTSANNSAQKSTAQFDQPNIRSAASDAAPVSKVTEDLKIRAMQILKTDQDNQYTPIKSLNSFLFDWKIKARITKKQAKKTWRNAKGEGTLLNIELIDFHGTQIVATFFNELANKYDLTLKENSVYLFSNGTVKIANQKYTSIKNDYCIIFDRSSEIQEVEDDNRIEAQGFSFVTIDEINEFEQNRTLDTIGVISTVGTISNFIPKNGGPSKDKRTLQICDESGLGIALTLWGKNASKYEFKEGDVAAIKGTRVSDYQGKTLNSGDEHSQIYINLDLKRTKELQQWYKLKGNRQISSVSYSNLPEDHKDGEGEGSSNSRLIEELTTWIEQDDQRMQFSNNTGNKNKLYKLGCFISYIKPEDKHFYLACEQCKKKVIENIEKTYSCENCGKVF